MTGLRASEKDRKKAREAVAAMMERFYLTGLEHHRPYQLSGGQQQRVALARILLTKPQLLMLDEPFSALDGYLRWKLELELMDILKGFGIPTLFVSHSRDEIYRICDQVCVMDQGKSTPVVPVKTMFEEPKTLASCMLSGCKNYSAAQLACRLAGKEGRADEGPAEKMQSGEGQRSGERSAERGKQFKETPAGEGRESGERPLEDRKQSGERPSERGQQSGKTLADKRWQRTVYAKDWGVCLECSHEVQEDIAYVGVRSHYIHILSENDPQELPNRFPCRIRRIVEDVFNMVIMVSPMEAASGDAQLRLEMPKAEWESYTGAADGNVGDTIWVWIAPHDILLLK